MPAIEDVCRQQKALYWEASGYDDYGRPKRAALSVELSVRWINVKSRVVDPKGNVIATDAQVIAGQDLVVGSIMWLGSLDDLAAELPGTGTGTDIIPTSNLMEVVQIDKIPDLKARNYRRVAFLRRFTDLMPDSA